MSVNNLTVTTADPDITMIAGGCKHGHIASSSPQMIVLSNTGYYGPDALIVLYRNGKAISMIEVQQNYGLLAAGQITANTVTGDKAHMKTVQGSFANGVGGQIIITSV